MWDRAKTKPNKDEKENEREKEYGNKKQQHQQEDIVQCLQMICTKNKLQIEWIRSNKEENK